MFSLVQRRDMQGRCSERGGGWGSHIKRGGMLVVSRGGVNFGFWSHLGCLGKMQSYVAVKVSFRVAREEI